MDDLTVQQILNGFGPELIRYDFAWNGSDRLLYVTVKELTGEFINHFCEILYIQDINMDAKPINGVIKIFFY